MSSSMNVIAFKPADEKWQRMKAVYDACEAAGVRAPDKVERYFGGDKPDPAGVEVSEQELLTAGAVREWREEMREGYEVDVTELPPDVTIVRFFMSY
jgi:hypothetical protein